MWLATVNDGRLTSTPFEVDDNEPYNNRCTEIDNPQLFDEKMRGFCDEFRVEDGHLVFDPLPWHLEYFEKANFDAYETSVEQDAAICELYEMMIGEQDAE